MVSLGTKRTFFLNVSIFSTFSSLSPFFGYLTLLWDSRTSSVFINSYLGGKDVFPKTYLENMGTTYMNG